MCSHRVQDGDDLLALLAQLLLLCLGGFDDGIVHVVAAAILEHSVGFPHGRRYGALQVRQLLLQRVLLGGELLQARV